MSIENWIALIPRPLLPVYREKRGVIGKCFCYPNPRPPQTGEAAP